MSTVRQKKIQSLIIRQLMDCGKIDILLPDGIELEIGTTQEDEFGNLVQADDYCFVVAKRDGKSTLLDSYNTGLQYRLDCGILLDDQRLDPAGFHVRRLDVV